jgi:hypothetical protein
VLFLGEYDHTCKKFLTYTLEPSSHHSSRKCRSVLTRTLCSGRLTIDLLHFTLYPKAYVLSKDTCTTRVSAELSTTFRFVSLDCGLDKVSNTGLRNKFLQFHFCVFNSMRYTSILVPSPRPTPQRPPLGPRNRRADRVHARESRDALSAIVSVAC